MKVIGLTVVHHPHSKSGWTVNIGGQLMAALWLLYMDASALYAITDVKIWGNRALVKRQTYAESACWYSMQVAKRKKALCHYDPSPKEEDELLISIQSLCP